MIHEDPLIVIVPHDAKQCLKHVTCFVRRAKFQYSSTLLSASQRLQGSSINDASIEESLGEVRYAHTNCNTKTLLFCSERYISENMSLLSKSLFQMVNHLIRFQGVHILHCKHIIIKNIHVPREKNMCGKLLTRAIDRNNQLFA